MSGRTIRQTVRFRLGRCLSCWKRGVYVVTLTPEDGYGNRVGTPVRHHICDKHATEAMAALAPVAEEIGVTLDDGTRIAARPAPTSTDTTENR